MYYEVVRSVYLPAIDIGDGDSLDLCVEVLQQRDPNGPFFARVWNHQLCRVIPTICDEDIRKQGADELLRLEDCTRDWAAFRGDSAEAVLSRVLVEIKSIFGDRS